MSTAVQFELEIGGRAVGRSGGHGDPAVVPAFHHLASPTAVPPDRLTVRLRAFGVTAQVVTHANRRILVSLTGRGVLRVHLGYAMAPDAVIAAIARWARPRIPRAERREAQRMLAAFPVHEHVPPAREPRRLREPARPGDERILARLRELHHELNARHFAGSLGPVTLLLSSRMQRRLGEFRPADGSGPGAICISRRHLRRDGWRAVGETLAHELVHQWQAETGRKLAHDAIFRQRCAALGIDPGATRRLDNDLLRSS